MKPEDDDDGSEWRACTIRWPGKGGKKEEIPYFVEKVSAFCCWYPTPDYDRRVMDNASKPIEESDPINEEDITAINQYGSRSRAAAWNHLRDASRGDFVKLLQGIDRGQSLFAPDLSKETLDTLRALLALCLDQSGIGPAGATKMLHLKRPHLVPICDSVVLERFTGRSAHDGSVRQLNAVMNVLHALRNIGCTGHNKNVLRIAQRHLQTVLEDDHAYCKMSKVKILDCALWIDVPEREQFWSLLV